MITQALDEEFKPEFILNEILFGSLPASYDGLVIVLKSNNKEMTPSFVGSKVIDEYVALMYSTTASAAKNTPSTLEDDLLMSESD